MTNQRQRAAVDDARATAETLAQARSLVYARLLLIKEKKDWRL